MSWYNQQYQSTEGTRAIYRAIVNQPTSHGCGYDAITMLGARDRLGKRWYSSSVTNGMNGDSSRRPVSMHAYMMFWQMLTSAGSVTAFTYSWTSIQGFFMSFAPSLTKSWMQPCVQRDFSGRYTVAILAGCLYWRHQWFTWEPEALIQPKYPSSRTITSNLQNYIQQNKLKRTVRCWFVGGNHLSGALYDL